MANDVSDTLRQALVRTLQEAVGGEQEKPKSGGGGTGKGLLAGVALAAAAPLAKRGLEAARSGQLDDFVSKLGTGQALEDVRSRFADGDDGGDRDDGDGGREEPEAESAGDERDGREERNDQHDDEDGDDDRAPGGGPQATGKGRRMPIQQSVDIGAPIETVYNQFTQFEDWPQFMHRVTRVTQEDDCEISFATKIWGKTKEFTAKIETQRPEERIKWKVSQGITHNGVVTFHELGPHLTKVMVTLDVQPGSLIEKAARGMRHVKRAVRGDLARFKAFIEMQELETGAWRGVIEHGEVVEPHDESYDEERDYSDVEDMKADGEDESEDADDDAEDREDEDEDDEVRQPRRRERARRRTPAPA